MSRSGNRSRCDGNAPAVATPLVLVTRGVAALC